MNQDEDDYLASLRRAFEREFRPNAEAANEAGSQAKWGRTESGMSLLITQAQRAQLRRLGCSEDEIHAMTPAEAHRRLGLS